MREIKFRGKRTDNGEWVYGYYLVAAGMSFISVFAVREPVFVDSETVGQYTGLHDENGKEIYEGDIVLFSSSWNQTEEYKKRYGSKETVEYEDGAFTNCTPGSSTEKGDIIEVIGNIHE